MDIAADPAKLPLRRFEHSTLQVFSLCNLTREIDGTLGDTALQILLKELHAMNQHNDNRIDEEGNRSVPQEHDVTFGPYVKGELRGQRDGDAESRKNEGKRAAHVPCCQRDRKYEEGGKEDLLAER